MTSRPPSEKLSRDRVVEAATELIREGGFAGFSMRRLGERLRMDPMAAYRHVAGKQAILDAVADRVFAAVEPPSQQWSWQRQVTALALSCRDAIDTFPTMAPYIAARAQLEQLLTETE